MNIFNNSPEVKNETIDMTIGDILQDHLDSASITAYRLSVETGVSQTRVSQILNNKRGISTETALRFGKFFGTTPNYWLNLQNGFDIRLKSEAMKVELGNIEELKKPYRWENE